jgi:SAM-dependent methyltransferase
LDGIDFAQLGSVPLASATDIFSIPAMRHYIAKTRWEKFIASGQQMAVHPSVASGMLKDTIPYNIQGVWNSINDIVSLERSELVFRPLMCIDKVYWYPRRRVWEGQKALLIGSRTEYEVLVAMGYGMELSSIHAVDLFSYSPWITPGDMHALPYPDNSFDLIIMGWVLGYSQTPEIVAREVSRVARPGAVVSIGNDSYAPEAAAGSPYVVEGRARTAKDMLKYFGSNVGKVYFQHDPCYPKNDVPHLDGHIIVTFGIEK